ncbi:MAG: acetate uptake transporter [Pseudonocardia sp.]|nr:acetate uptake transporter [Pseudonocardia sp.]
MSTSEMEAQPTSSPEHASPANPVADPAPLGLGAFAATTFLLSLFNAGIVAESLEPVVLPVALFYGGLAQFLAGMWEFRNRNTFGALAFTSYGAFWLSFAAYVQFVAPTLPEDSASTATGLYLLIWTIFTAYMTVAALRVNAAVAAVFILLTPTFLALTLADLLGVSVLGTIGGILGLLTAIAAWYASFAGVLQATWGRAVLPVGPR